jgi:GNAT superfamily N-acetyltransferase
VIELERTENTSYLRNVFTHEAIWEWVCDDGVSKDDYYPVIHDCVDYLIPRVDGVAVGALMLVKQSEATVELHTAILPEHQGRHVKAIFAELLKWAKDKGYNRIRTWVPDGNKAAYVAAEQGAFLKDGKHHDLHLFGVTLCQRQ